MTTGGQNKADEIQETSFFDNTAITKFIDIGGYLCKGKHKSLWLLIITSLMCLIIIIKLIYLLLLGFRGFFSFLSVWHGIQIKSLYS